MIMHWLGTLSGWFRALPVGIKWLLVIWIIAAVLTLIIDGWMDRTIQTAVEAGAAEQRETDLRETIRNVEKANAARDEVHNDIDGARYNQCLRTARTPANCKRFLPARHADQR